MYANSVAPELDNNVRDLSRERSDGAVYIGGFGHAADFGFVGEQDIDEEKNLLQWSAPNIVWILVRIERYGQSRQFPTMQELRQSIVKAALQVERRKMNAAACVGKNRSRGLQRSFQQWCPMGAGARRGVREPLSETRWWRARYRPRSLRGVGVRCRRSRLCRGVS
jgi:hypothetical protein